MTITSVTFAGDTSTHTVARDIVRAEEEILRRLEVEDRLRAVVTGKSGLGLFAEAFYFIRYDFCRLNFIVGSRFGSCDERLWKGLVDNLFEELGAGKGPSHNELYRWFLSEAGKDETGLSEPEFARDFNGQWEAFCRTTTPNKALSAIGVYEILDNPDYKMLLRVARSAGVSKKALRFFAVHAGAKHFGLFEKVVGEFILEDLEMVNTATNFVLDLQSRMWADLLSHLECEINFRS